MFSLKKLNHSSHNLFRKIIDHGMLSQCQNTANELMLEYNNVHKIVK